MIDDRTPHLKLPLPHPFNELNEDAPRLRSALTGVDVAFADVDSALIGVTNELAQKANAADVAYADANATAHASLYAAINSAAGSIKWADLQGKPAAFPATAHKTSHKTGAADAIAQADIGAATANHTHTPQTTVSGNAGTATKLQTARTIILTGAVTGSAKFDGAANVSIALKSNLLLRP